jgi:hypothetical protein
MKYLILSHGKFSQVDAADFDWLNQWKWSYRRDGYVVRAQHVGVFNGKQKQQMIRLHRFIMAAPEGMSVDHVNGDGLDNRRCNLRICTHTQNHQNRKSRVASTSIYKGVYWWKHRQCWIAKITVNGSPKTLGQYDNQEEAALAYNAAAIKYFGEFANPNVVH